MDQTTIAIVGSGLVGRAWAITFARAGYRVRLCDTEPAAVAAAREFMAGMLPDLEAAGLLRGQAPDEIMRRVSTAGSLAEAVAGADYVQECTREDIDAKKQVFAELDAAADGDAVLASSTSYILPSVFSEELKGRDRCLVAHPINPPYLVPAVEIVPAPWTSAASVEKARRILGEAGQSCIRMEKEIDGFLMNRLQCVLMQEGLRLVEEGYATAEDVDRGIRDGLGLRWAFMGPFETADLNAPGGVKDYAERYGERVHAVGTDDSSHVRWDGPVIEAIDRDRRAALPLDRHGERQAWRDRRLMALVAHKAHQDDNENT